MNCRAATRISSRLSDPRARRWWPAFVPDGLLAATSHPSSVGKLSICLTREYRTGSERLLLAYIVALTLRLSGQAVKPLHTATIVSLGPRRGTGHGDNRISQERQARWIGAGPAGPHARDRLVRDPGRPGRRHRGRHTAGERVARRRRGVPPPVRPGRNPRSHIGRT